MHLTLLVADLVPPELFIAPPDLPALPALQTLLAQGAVSRSQGAFLEEACMQQLGLRHIASNPVAALTLLADGGEPGNDTWLRADPVHLSVSRDNVQLLDSHRIDPTREEADALVADINKHLAADGLAIEVRDAARWYMRIPADEALETSTLWRASGQNLFDHLPADSRGVIHWRRLQNELQMLMATHPVNAAREQDGRPTINGLWFWGAGALAEPPPVTQEANRKVMLKLDNEKNAIRPPVVPRPKVDHPYKAVLAKLALARGLAMDRKLSLGELPQAFPAPEVTLLNPLCVIHTTTRALRRNDRAEWMHIVKQLDENWFAPAREAVSAGRLDSLTLLLPNERGSLKTKLMPARRWQFLKRLRASATSGKKISAYL
jgi:hypothetical protein